jgi:probable rRNA maturation factor
VTHAIHLLSDQGLSRFRKGLAAAARAALAYAAAPPGELSIRLMDDESIRALNAQYAGEDRATDVLSFASPADDPARAVRYFGDIALAVPVAQAQAARAGHPLEDELALLTVHGVLHLLGYDHADEPGQRRMWDAQAEILGRLHLTTPAELLTPS